MAGKLKHSSSRKMKHGHKTHHVRKTHHMRKTHHNTRRNTRRNRRRNGGADVFVGAPVRYHLSGSWPSQMSLGQGADYFKYHEGQHGGALSMGPFPGAVLDSGLPAALRGPAHIGGIDKAITDVKGLCDPPNCPGTMSGGKRRNKSNKGGRRNKSKKGGRRNKSKKGGRRNKNKRGGAVLGYAPFPSSGMLLSSPTQYAQASLNPEWKTDVAFTDAKIRDTQ